jgi:hypothetical protein
LVRLLPVRPKSGSKADGSVPPLMTKLLIVVATLIWFCDVPVRGEKATRRWR